MKISGSGYGNDADLRRFTFMLMGRQRIDGVEDHASPSSDGEQ